MSFPYARRPTLMPDLKPANKLPLISRPYPQQQKTKTFLAPQDSSLSLTLAASLV
jgi:hypothetical protein